MLKMLTRKMVKKWLDHKINIAWFTHLSRVNKTIFNVRIIWDTDFGFCFYDISKTLLI